MARRKRDEELVVITKMYELIMWSRNHTIKFPQNHCLVCARIEQRLYDLLETLIGAKYSGACRCQHFSRQYRYLLKADIRNENNRFPGASTLPCRNLPGDTSGKYSNVVTVSSRVTKSILQTGIGETDSAGIRSRVWYYGDRMDRFECDKCGACCKGTLIVEADDLDVLREPRLMNGDPECCGKSVEQMVSEIQQQGKIVLLACGSPCSFLGMDNRCSIYPTRPNACVAMQAGDEQCQDARMAVGLAPLLPIASS